MPNDSAQIEVLRNSLYENPANRSYYHAALSHASTRVPFDVLASVVAETPAPATCTVRPKNAITNLVRNGGLLQTIEVDGRPYEGGYEDLLADEGVSPDAEVVYYVELTEDGRALLAEIKPSSRIDALLEGKPGFLQGFLSVLGLCAAHEGGAARTQIEADLRAHPETLAIDERTGLEGVAPSFYTTNLEDVGALAWADGRWHITDAGACALAEWAAGDSRRGEDGAVT